MSGVNELDCYMTYDIGKYCSVLYIPPVTTETVGFSFRLAVSLMKEMGKKVLRLLISLDSLVW